MKPNVEIYTDGSCPVPQGAGGYAAIIRVMEPFSETRISGGKKVTTNNQMEIGGIIAALKILDVPSTVLIVSDSQYCTKGISEWLPKWKKNNWKRRTENGLEPIANLELWKELDELLKNHDVKVQWVRGHNNHPENEWCDSEAGRQTKLYKD